MSILYIEFLKLRISLIIQKASNLNNNILIITPKSTAFLYHQNHLLNTFHCYLNYYYDNRLDKIYSLLSMLLTACNNCNPYMLVDLYRTAKSSQQNFDCPQSSHLNCPNLTQSRNHRNQKMRYSVDYKLIHFFGIELFKFKKKNFIIKLMIKINRMYLIQ